MTNRLANREEPIPGYRLLERLGRGGFGEVWKCEAPGGLHKAIKFVFGDMEGMGEDGAPAEQELKALNRVKSIRHPFILTLEQIQIVDGQLLIVMELADRNLWDRYRECRGLDMPGIPRDELLGYMDESAEALDLMNRQYHLQHLDIKPQNIFLVHNHVKIADFGLAKDLEDMRATVTGGVTPSYASPETFGGEISPFSDQYSLAIVYQELLTGKRPFNGSNTRQLFMQHLHGEPDLELLPESDRAAIGRSLSKDPKARFPTCRELVEALRQGNGGVASAGDRTAYIPEDGPRTQPAHRMPLGLSRPRPSDPERKLPGPAKRSRFSSLPPLTTPKQLTDNHPVTSPIGAASYTPARETLGNHTLLARDLQAPEERTGDGVLVPALIIGLGGTGAEVLKRFRVSTRERFGSGVELANIRYLLIDTDGETLRASCEGEGAIPPGRMFHARLDRPSYYAKRDSLPATDSWLSPQMLFKLPKSQKTNGVRAFGRLALCDHYRAIVSRIREALEDFASDDLLDKASKATGLALRSNRPRVYIVSGLNGGTGSGMFIDLAYIARYELRAMGYRDPQVIGVLPMPPDDARSAAADPNRTANCFAALTELNHFASPGTCYEAKFDEREAVIVDAERPFRRCLLVSLPKGDDDNRAKNLNGLTAQLLTTELLTPVGRLADESRPEYEASVTAGVPGGAWCQAAGLYRFSWPRPALVRMGGRRLCAHFLKRWASKDHELFVDELAGWVNDEWKRRQLDAQSMINAFYEAGEQYLGKTPEEAFNEILSPVLSPAARPERYDAESGVALLDRIVSLLGKPESQGESKPGTLVLALSDFSRTLIRQAEVKTVEMAMAFVEEPGHRLPAAEAAIQLMVEKLKTTLATIEARAKSLDGHARDILSRMLGQIGSLASRKRGLTHEVVDLLGQYPQKRYQAVILHAVKATLRSLLGSLPDQTRDLQSYRLFLDEQLGIVTEQARRDRRFETDAGRLILPHGCDSLRDACVAILKGIPGETIHNLELKLQAKIRRTFGSLASACQRGSAAGSVLRELIEQECFEFLELEVPRSSAMDAFFLNEAGEVVGMDAHRDILAAFDDAAPGLSVSRALAASQLNVLAVPPSDRTAEFRGLVADVLPDVEFTEAESPTDILFYREIRHLPLASLSHLSPPAQAAFEKADPSHPPHARTDVAWRMPRRS